MIQMAVEPSIMLQISVFFRYSRQSTFLNKDLTFSPSKHKNHTEIMGNVFISGYFLS